MFSFVRFRSTGHVVLRASLVAVTALGLITVAAAGNTAKAATTAPAGGLFVSTQGRIMDTRPNYKIGAYSTPMTAGVWRKVQVNGLVGVPATGVTAVALTITVLNPTENGYVQADQDDSSPNTATSYMNFVAGTMQSNTRRSTDLGRRS